MSLGICEEFAKEFCAFLLDLLVGQNFFNNSSHIKLHTILNWGGRTDVISRVVVTLIFGIELLPKAITAIHKWEEKHHLNNSGTQK